MHRLLRNAFSLLGIVAIATLGPGCLETEEPKPKADPLPLDSSSAALKATENVEACFADIESAFSALEEADFLGPIGGDDCAGPDGDVPAGEGMEEACSEGLELSELPKKLGEASASVVELLKEHVLVASQLESEDGSEVVYLLKSGVFCTALPDDAQKPCAEVLDAYSVRVAVVSYAEGDVDMALRFGEKQHEAVSFELHANRLSVRVDLGAAASALADAGAVLKAAGSEIEVPVPDAMGGVVRGIVEKTGPKSIRTTAEVLSPVFVDHGDIHVVVGVSKATTEADGVAKALSSQMAVGTILAEMPMQVVADNLIGGDVSCGAPAAYDPETGETEMGEPTCEKAEAPKIGGTLAVFVAGLTGSAAIKSGEKKMVLSGLSLGKAASWAALDGEEILTVDLGSFDLTVVPGSGAKSTILQVKPGLDLTVKLAMAAIAADLDLPSWTKAETLHATLSGAAAAAVEVGKKAVKVLQGTFELSSTAAPAETVSAGAGMCLVEGPGGGHELLSEIAVIACP